MTSRRHELSVLSTPGAITIVIHFLQQTFPLTFPSITALFAGSQTSMSILGQFSSLDPIMYGRKLKKLIVILRYNTLKRKIRPSCSDRLCGAHAHTRRPETEASHRRRLDSALLRCVGPTSVRSRVDVATLS